MSMFTRLSDISYIEPMAMMSGGSGGGGWQGMGR